MAESVGHHSWESIIRARRWTASRSMLLGVVKRLAHSVDKDECRRHGRGSTGWATKSPLPDSCRRVLNMPPVKRHFDSLDISFSVASRGSGRPFQYRSATASSFDPSASPPAKVYSERPNPERSRRGRSADFRLIWGGPFGLSATTREPLSSLRKNRSTSVIVCVTHMAAAIAEKSARSAAYARVGRAAPARRDLRASG